MWFGGGGGGGSGEGMHLCMLGGREEVGKGCIDGYTWYTVFKPRHFNIQHSRLLFTKNSTVEKPTKWSDVTIRKVLLHFRYHAVAHVRCTIRREVTQI